MEKNDKEEERTWVQTWISKGKAHLSGTRGYAELLLKNKAGELTDDQRLYIKEIFKSCMVIADCLRALSYHTTYRYGEPDGRCRARRSGR